jgi:hypothetical protein
MASAKAQSGLVWEDSCSGMFVGRVITPKLVNDSVINVCIGETISVEDTSVDKLHGETISVRYKFGGDAYKSQKKFEYVPTLANNTML